MEKHYKDTGESSCRNDKQCAKALFPHECGKTVQQVKTRQGHIVKDVNTQLHKAPILILGNSSETGAPASLFSAYTKGSPPVHLSQEQISRGRNSTRQDKRLLKFPLRWKTFLFPVIIMEYTGTAHLHTESPLSQALSTDLSQPWRNQKGWSPHFQLQFSILGGRLHISTWRQIHT